MHEQKQKRVFKILMNFNKLFNFEKMNSGERKAKEISENFPEKG